MVNQGEIARLLDLRDGVLGNRELGEIERIKLDRDFLSEKFQALESYLGISFRVPAGEVLGRYIDIKEGR